MLRENFLIFDRKFLLKDIEIVVLEIISFKRSKSRMIVILRYSSIRSYVIVTLRCIIIRSMFYYNIYSECCS